MAETELSEKTKVRLQDLQLKLHANDLDEAANTAIDFVYTLLDMGGEAHLVNDTTGKGFKVSVK